MSRSALSLVMILLVPLVVLLGGLRWLAGGVLAQTPLLEESSVLATADWARFAERPDFYQLLSSEPGWVLGSYAYPVEADEKGGLLLGQWLDGAWRLLSQYDPQFREWLAAAPSDLVASELRRLLLGAGGPAGPAQLSLPWQPQAPYWRLYGGPHTFAGAGCTGSEVCNSLDFNGPTDGRYPVVAARDGWAYLACENLVVILHDDGWETSYYHLIDTAIIASGQLVSRGQLLGYSSTAVGCGGSAAGPHVHLSLYRDGAPIAFDEVLIGGWQAQSDTAAYLGCVSRPGYNTVCGQGPIHNNGEIGGQPACAGCQATLTYTVSDWTQPGLLTAIISWTNALTGWHQLAWGDGTRDWFYGAAGELQRQHHFAAGHYTATVTLLTPAGPVVAARNYLSVPPECREPTSLAGIVLYAASGCRGQFRQLLTAGLQAGAGIQSVQMPAGVSLQIFEMAAGGGQSLCLSWTVADLSRYRWPDGSAVQAIGSVAAYANPGCLSETDVPPFSLQYSVPDPDLAGQVQAVARWSGMAGVGHRLVWGDGSSSPLAGSSGTVTLTHTYLPGHYTMTLQLRAGSLTLFSDEERVNVRANCAELMGEAVTLFNLPDCLGAERALPGAGWAELAALSARAESIYVPAGQSVQLYPEPFLAGTGYCLTATAPDLAQLVWPNGANLANAVRSLQSFTNPNCSQDTLSLSVTPDTMAPGLVAADVSWAGAAGFHLLLWGDGTTTTLSGAAGSAYFTHEYDQPGFWTAYLVIVDPAGFQQIQPATFLLPGNHRQFLPSLRRAGS